MKRFREWLRWLVNLSHSMEQISHDTANGRIKIAGAELRIQRLETELAQLRLEIYQPPQQVDIPKIITKCRTFKQFTDAVEREMQDKE